MEYVLFVFRSIAWNNDRELLVECFTEQGHSARAHQIWVSYNYSSMFLYIPVPRSCSSVPLITNLSSFVPLSCSSHCVHLFLSLLFLSAPFLYSTQPCSYQLCSVVPLNSAPSFVPPLSFAFVPFS